MICQCKISSDETVKSENTELALCLGHRFPTNLHALRAALDRKEMRVNLPTQTHRGPGRIPGISGGSLW